MQNNYDIVFVVLVYRNTADLNSFFNCFHIKNSKVIVVNSFYDKETEIEFGKIAKKNHADYISVPNKGYGAGNNRGCEFALSHYKFSFLVISNADILIKNLDVNSLSTDMITGPNIINKRGKQQNPARAFNLPMYEWLMYHFYKKRWFWGVKLCCAVNKLSRYVFYLMNGILGYAVIKQVHGAFIIIPYEALNRMQPLFNENMFLFAEEDHLARLAKKHNVKMTYNKDVIVHHKEDGSVGLMDIKQMETTRDSYITYYEYWNKER